MKRVAPELLVVVDTEEEFDWTRPFDRANIATTSILAQERAQAIYDRLGVTPTYMIDYPVATSGEGAAYLRSLKDARRAEIGAHLHAWVTPPHEETVDSRNSFQCNLPSALERAKLESLTEAVTEAMGERPIAFKAGRYGFGAETARHLVDLGYRIDCSVLAHHDLRADGGPDFIGVPDQPHWLADAPDLLEIPVTNGFFGAVPSLSRAMPHLFDSRLATRLRLPGILARSGLVARSRLSPEGISAAEQKRLLRALVRAGGRTFSLVYHSSSLAPGHTPYVWTQGDLDRFIETLEDVLTWFRDELDGRFTTPSRVHARMSAERAATLQAAY